MDMQSGRGAPNKITSTPPLTPVPSIQSLDQRRTGCCARRPNSKKYQKAVKSSEPAQDEPNDPEIHHVPAVNRNSRSSLNALPSTTNSNNKHNNATPTITTAVVSVPASDNSTELEPVCIPGGCASGVTSSSSSRDQQNPSVVKISTL